MTGRACVVVLALFVGALSATAGASCTSTTTIVPTGIDEPPTLRIVSPVNGDCVAIPDTPNAVVPVTVDLAGSFYLRPPGTACADLYNCGYLQLYVDNAPNATSATATVNANLGNFGNPYGTFTLTVELVWDLNDGGGQDQFDAQITYDGSAPPAIPVCGGNGSADASATDGGATGGSASGVGSLSPTGYYQACVTITTAPSCPASGGASSSSGTGGAPSDGGSDGAVGSSSSSASSSGSGAGGAPTDGGASAGTGGAPTDGGASAGTGGAGPSDAGDAVG